MYWRNRKLGHGEPKKRALGRLVRAGREPGLLAYEDGEPVGWVSVAPREEFRPLLSSPQYRPQDEDKGIWSIVCFTVDRQAQGRGIAAVLLEGAVEHAHRHGAASVEGYAHLSKSDNYMGGIDLFRAHGFRTIRTTAKRAIVRRDC